MAMNAAIDMADETAWIGGQVPAAADGARGVPAVVESPLPLSRDRIAGAGRPSEGGN
ncbi:hypothetical protein GL279_06105 [Paracoccus limosus]|uniref:Uncharacterized protein n=2 Tax=Paracoccus limosus TaxID=913252 RepID=A0A844H3Q4_9RHOB|nr:hypothetical protein [Paracoccus limosus]